MMMDTITIPAGLDPLAVWNAALSACRSAQADLQSSKPRGDAPLDDPQAALARAIDLLIITPAPDQAALLLKIEFMASSFAQFAIEGMMLRALAADGRRLLGEG